MFLRDKRRGFTFIGMLMALVIILILMGNYMGPDKDSKKNWAQTNIDKSKNTACMANRITAKTQISMYTVNHQGEPLTIESVEKAGFTITRCPQGGVYTLSPKGDEIYCSIHFPPPEEKKDDTTADGGNSENSSAPEKEQSPQERQANDLQNQIGGMLGR